MQFDSLNEHINFLSISFLKDYAVNQEKFNMGLIKQMKI